MKPCCVKIEKLKIAKKNKKGVENLERTYKCHLCMKISPCYFGLNIHMRKKHPERIFFKCAYVSCLHLFFDSDEERKKHAAEQHSSDSDGPKLFQCDSCSKVYKSHYVLSAHMASIHGISIVMCSYPKCEEFFKNEADHQQHFSENHQRSENAKTCIYCGRWMTMKSLRRHILEQHQAIAIECSYSNHCASFFLTKNERDEHIKKVHLAEQIKKMVTCIYCGLSFVRGTCFSTHVRLMHKGVSIKCRFLNCGMFFKTQEECDEHFKELHEEKDKSKNILCPKCSYKTNDTKCFNVHFKFKHGKDKLKCNQCEGSVKIFKSIEALKHHVRTKHKKQTFPHCNKSMMKCYISLHLTTEYCSVCKVKQLCKGMISEHKKLCKPKCEICQYKNNSGIRLLKHLTNVHKVVDFKKLTWLGDLRNLKKNMECEKCEGYFYNATALSRHIRKFHGENKLLSCDLCKKQLHSHFNIERHMLTAHGFKPKSKNKVF